MNEKTRRVRRLARTSLPSPRARRAAAAFAAVIAIAACGGDELPAIETSSSSTGAGGDTGCTPGEKQPCYTGPAATDGVGACKQGEQVCNPDGKGFALCENQVLPGVEVCGSADDEDCDGTAAPPCAGHHLWSTRFGGSGDEQARGLAVDATGSALLTGSYGGATAFGATALGHAGLTDAFVAKLDPAGAPVWAKGFGDAGAQSGAAVAVDAQGAVYVVGTFDGDIDLGGGALTSAGATDVFVAKLDAGGSHVWSRALGGIGADRGHAIAVTSAGDVAIAGDFSDVVDLGGGPLTSAGGTDALIARLDASGAHVWSSGHGDLADQTASGVTFTSSGDVVATGSFAGAIDLGGGAVTSAGATDAFVAAFAKGTGQPVWSRSFGDASPDRGVAVGAGPDGTVVATGAFEGTIDPGGGPLTSAGKQDVFLVKLDALGQHVWSHVHGDMAEQIPTAITVDAKGDIALTGQFGGSMKFGGATLPAYDVYDVFVAKLDAAGEHIHSDAFGAAFDQIGLGVALSQDGSALLAGRFVGTFDLGGEPLVTGGLTDVFVAKLAP